MWDPCIRTWKYTFAFIVMKTCFYAEDPLHLKRWSLISVVIFPVNLPYKTDNFYLDTDLRILCYYFWRCCVSCYLLGTIVGTTEAEWLDQFWKLEDFHIQGKGLSVWWLRTWTLESNRSHFKVEIHNIFVVWLQVNHLVFKIHFLTISILEWNKIIYVEHWAVPIILDKWKLHNNYYHCGYQ